MSARCAHSHCCDCARAACWHQHLVSHGRLLLLQVAESATQFFIANDRPTVSGLVLAGSADFKTELSQSDMFDQRLQAIVLAVVDVSYGTSAGLYMLFC